MAKLVFSRAVRCKGWGISLVLRVQRRPLGANWLISIAEHHLVRHPSLSCTLSPCPDVQFIQMFTEHYYMQDPMPRLDIYLWPLSHLPGYRQRSGKEPREKRSASLLTGATDLQNPPRG